MNIERIINDTLEMATILVVMPQRRSEFISALKKSGIIVTEDLKLIGGVDQHKILSLVNNLSSLPVIKLALRRAIRKYS